MFLFTNGELDRLGAGLALHVAAPVELALAPLLHSFLDSIVSPPATHQVTPVHPLRVNVAHSALRSKRSDGVVAVTVVRGVLDEHQVVRRWDPEVPPVHFEPTTPCGSNSRGGVVFLLQIVTNFSERGQLLPASDQAARAGDAVALARHLHVGDHRPAPGLVVVEVHQLPAGKRRDRSSRSLRTSRLLLRLALADVDEVLSKFVSILHVVSTASPNPLVFEITRPLCIAAAATSELTIATTTTHAVNDTSAGNSVSKSCLSRWNGEDWAKDGRVVDCGTIPTTMSELELTLANSTPGPPAHVDHVVGVEETELLLAWAQTLDSVTKRRGGADV